MMLSWIEYSIGLLTIPFFFFLPDIVNFFSSRTLHIKIFGYDEMSVDQKSNQRIVEEQSRARYDF
jgi:hypothetical protein